MGASLYAPFSCVLVPLDGINEKGLAIGVLYLEDEPTSKDNGKVDMMTTTMIRVVLDRAATVEEAIALFETYDMHDSVGACYHYQIADANGASVIIEYVDNEMMLYYPEEKEGNITNFQMLTNFYITENVSDKGIGMDRYEKVEQTLTASKGVTTKIEAMSLLKEARLQNYVEESGFINDTQWSIVYDLTNRSLNICIGMNYDKVYRFAVNSPMQVLD